jgi:hypothetical protein
VKNKTTENGKRERPKTPQAVKHVNMVARLMALLSHGSLLRPPVLPAALLDRHRLRFESKNMIYYMYD